MGNAESSTNGGKLEEKEEEERAKLARMLKAGAIAAAGLATVAAAGVAASRYLQSSPPPSYSLELDGDHQVLMDGQYGSSSLLQNSDSRMDDVNLTTANSGWYSINVDFSGPSKQENTGGFSGSAGIGYVVSDGSGEVVFVAAKPLTSVDKDQGSTQGEAVAVLSALQAVAVWFSYIRKVRLKCDSETLVKAINGRCRHAKPSSEMNANVQAIINAMNKFECCEVLHVPRDQNQVANHLSRLAKKNEWKWPSGNSGAGVSPPREMIIPAVFLEADGLRWPRA